MNKNRVALLINVIALLIVGTAACRKKDSVAGEQAGLPQIIGFFPASGAADTLVTIVGNNFSDDKSRLVVKFGSTAATEITTATANQITVKVPKQTIPGPVKLSVVVSDKEIIAGKEFWVEPTTWNKLFGGTGDDAARAMARTADGGFIIAGETYTNTQGSADVLIIKTDADGNKLWQKTYGGDQADQVKQVAVAADGSIAVIATTLSNNMGDVGVNHGGYDIWVLKLDAAGNLQWQKTYGSADTDQAASITETNDGNFVFTGHTNGNNSGDVGASHGLYDIWVVKINSAGNLLWQKTYGGANTEQAASVISGTDGSLVVAGSSNSNNVGDVGPTKGGYDIWIIKLDATGKLTWQKTYGGNATEMAGSIINTAEGGYAAAGYTTSGNSGDVGPNHGSNDIWVLKLGADGTLQWQNALGGGTDQYSTGICQNQNGNIVVAGFTTGGNDGDVGASIGQEDAWIVKLSASGSVIAQTVKGGIANDRANGIIPVAGAGYVIAGYTDSNKSGDVGASNGKRDMWLFKIRDL